MPSRWVGDHSSGLPSFFVFLLNLVEGYFFAFLQACPLVKRIEVSVPSASLLSYEIKQIVGTSFLVFPHRPLHRNMARHNRKKAKGQARLAIRLVERRIRDEAERLYEVDRIERALYNKPRIYGLPAELRAKIFSYAVVDPDLVRGGAAMQNFISQALASKTFHSEARYPFYAEGGFLVLTWLGRRIKPNSFRNYDVMLPLFRRFRFREVRWAARPQYSVNLQFSPFPPLHRPNVSDDRFEIELIWFPETLTLRDRHNLWNSNPDPRLAWYLQRLRKTERWYAATVVQTLHTAMIALASTKQPGEGLTRFDLAHLVRDMRIESPEEEYRRLHG